jgi:hypothetical protein
MRTRQETILSEVLPAEERVIEAVVARYQRVAPAVTRFARAVAHNDDLQVRLGSQASSTHDEIVIDPGVFQAAYARNAPVTPTEVALASALHEAIHLVATDLDEKRPLPPEWMPQHQDAEDPGEVPLEDQSPLMFEEDMPEAPTPVPDDEEPADPGTPVTLLDALSQAGGAAAEALFLSLEDARQEAVYFAGYGGARSVLADLYLASVPQAMAQARPLGQYALACFLIVGGYLDRDRLQRRVDPHVATALDDAMVFLDAVSATADPWDVGGLALQLLQVARLHGLVEEAGPGSSPSARRTVDEAHQAQIAESVDAVRIVSPVLQDAERYDETRQAAQVVTARGGKRDEAEQAGDPATDQIVRISEAPTVYLPTGQAGKLVVVPFPDRFRTFGPEGHGLLAEAARTWGVAQRHVSGELYPLFVANQRRGLRSGFDAGDLSPYVPLLLGAGLYERMFERRDLPTRRAYSVSLLVDGSASMLQPRDLPPGRKSPWALSAAILGAWTLARLCAELQIDFEVALFNRSFAAVGDDSERSFLDRRAAATGALRRSQGGAAERLTRTVNHYLVKTFDERWRAAEDRLAGLFWMAASPQEAARRVRADGGLAPPISMFDKAANVDEYNLAYAAQRLVARRSSTRILVVLADGMTRGSVEALAASAEAVERGGTMVLGIGIGDATVQAAYARNQVVERPDELAAAMVGGVRAALYQTIARVGGDTWWAHSSERALEDPITRRSLLNA